MGLQPTSIRTALITGASSGFGEATARRLAPHVETLVILARRAQRLEAVAADIVKSTPRPPRVCVAVADVRDDAAVQDSLAPHAAHLDQLDLLVNNAGLALGLEPAHRANLDQWATMVDTNITSLLSLTRWILPGMVSRKRGHIINIGSVAGRISYPGANVYGATKAFVRQFSLNLRADLQGTGVRVTNIEPGLAETEFSVVRFSGDEEKANSVYRGTEPLTGKDIAETVAWCALLPPHVNVNLIEVMPTCQAFGPVAVHRETPV
jgi:NADP-dependent 3-hydroxy acid dehydrogenase YdfG